VDGVGKLGEERFERALASGRWVDRGDHAAPTVRVAVAEHPDGGRCLGNVYGPYANRAASSIERHESTVNARLLGDCVKWLGARVSKRALGGGMISSCELEVDNVTDLSDDLVRPEDVGGGSVLSSADNDIDGGSRNQSGDEGSKSNSRATHIGFRRVKRFVEGVGNEGGETCS